MGRKLKKRYKLPERCNVREFVMRELDANDEMEASMWADQNMTGALKDNALAAIGAEQREAMRLSFVSVDGKKVNADGVPFKEMDDWTMRTMLFVQKAFADLNGADQKEAKNFEAGAEYVEDDPEA